MTPVENAASINGSAARHFATRTFSRAAPTVGWSVEQIREGASLQLVFNAINDPMNYSGIGAVIDLDSSPGFDDLSAPWVFQQGDSMIN